MGRTDAIPRWLRRTGIEVLGWLLIVAGVLALVLPGPGLLTVAAGLVVLSLRYKWAKRLLIPIKARALMLATKGVQTWPRIIFSALGALAIIITGIIWGVRPPVPGWWPVSEWWWLVGGWNTAITLMASGVLALALIAYSFRRYRSPRSAV